MVNPKIINYSEATQNFKHACLSVPCGNRCEVKSPQEITVEYLDPNQDMTSNTLTLQGVDAVVLWHELNHILDGKTYIDTTLEALSSDELNKIEGIIIKEQENRIMNPSIIPILSVPPFHVTVNINNNGIQTLNEEALTETLQNTTNETLNGLLDRCRALEHDKRPSDKSIRSIKTQQLRTTPLSIPKSTRLYNEKSYAFHLKCLYSLTMLSSITFGLGVIVICVASPLWLGVTLTGFGAVSGILSLVKNGFFNESKKEYKANSNSTTEMNTDILAPTK
jgi:hypothetical protein